MRKETILKPLARKIAIREAQLKEAMMRKRLATTIYERHKCDVDEAEARARCEELKEIEKEIKNL